MRTNLLRVDAMAAELVGGASDFTSMELARAIARAELDLEQIRRLKAGLINAPHHRWQWPKGQARCPSIFNLQRLRSFCLN